MYIVVEEKCLGSFLNRFSGQCATNNKEPAGFIVNVPTHSLIGIIYLILNHGCFQIFLITMGIILR